MGLFSKLFGEPPAPAERPVRPSTSPARANLGSRRILVVEPSIIMQKIIELTLDGATVVTAKDAQEAQAALRNGRFDLVLSAAILPDLSGYDLCASVKSQAAPIPFILLRGLSEPFDESRARQAGADAVIAKPFTPDGLIDEINRTLG